jgi:hypothetical protein
VQKIQFQNLQHINQLQSFHIKKNQPQNFQYQNPNFQFKNLQVRDLNMPFGGTKQSGTGREGIQDSLHFFTEQKTICIKLPN